MASHFFIVFSVPFLMALGSILPPNLAPKIHQNLTKRERKALRSEMQIATGPLEMVGILAGPLDMVTDFTSLWPRLETLQSSQSSPQHAKNHPQNRPKTRARGPHFGGLGASFWSHFGGLDGFWLPGASWEASWAALGPQDGPNLGPKMAPSWSQNCTKRMPTSFIFLMP